MLFRCLIANVAVTFAASIVTYDVPDTYGRSDVYTLSVSGTMVTVLKYYEYDYAHFSLASGVKSINVTVETTETISDFIISPTKLDISGSKSGKNLSFSVSGSHYLIVKVNALKEILILIDAAEIDAPASSGEGIYNVVTAQGADRTGKELATSAFAAAISEASRDGGGTVYVPNGVYSVGNIILESHVSLYLEGGAFLIFTGHQSDYNINAYKNSQARNLTWWITTTPGSTTTKVFGRGTIDGRSAYTLKISAFEANLIMPLDTTDFTFDGPLLRESGTWAFTPTQSNGINISNVKILNEVSLLENDGIDINNCQNVNVNHGIVVAGDDCFSVKAWTYSTDIAKNWPGKFQNNKNIIFQDTVTWTTAMGYKIGFGNFYNTSNVSFTNGTVYQAYIGAGIDTSLAPYNSSTYNITFESIVVEKIVPGHNPSGGWMSILIKNNGFGAGPINLVTLKDFKILDYGGKGGTINGYNNSIKVSDVRLAGIVPPGSTTAARTLVEMNITHLAYESTVTISV